MASTCKKFRPESRHVPSRFQCGYRLIRATLLSIDLGVLEMRAVAHGFMHNRDQTVSFRPVAAPFGCNCRPSNPGTSATQRSKLFARIAQSAHLHEIKGVKCLGPNKVRPEREGLLDDLLGFGEAPYRSQCDRLG